MRQLARLALGPAVVAVFAGIELSSQGIWPAFIGAYGVFLLGQVAVHRWDAWRFRRARLRLAVARARMTGGASRHR